METALGMDTEKMLWIELSFEVAVAVVATRISCCLRLVEGARNEIRFGAGCLRIGLVLVGIGASCGWR